MALLKVIEWSDPSQNTIVHKFIPNKNDHINRGSKLTVRESQVAIFTDKGRLADIFPPGFYTLDTNNIPILTKLMSWKYGFESPFKSDVFFVNTKQFINQKWGTTSPILLYDPQFGNINVRGFGTYSFKVDGDRGAEKFLKEVFGTMPSYRTEHITEYLKSMVITGISDAFGNADVPVSRFAGKLRELGQQVKATLDEDFAEIGLRLMQFNVENFSFPKEIEEALNKNAAMNIQRGSMDVQMQMAQMEALKKAAANPGAGGVMGAGMGLGMGVQMGQMMGGMMNPQNFQQPQQQQPQQQPQQQQQLVKVQCAKCGELNKKEARFCHGCGNSMSNPVCPGCRKQVASGTKFCPDCGTRIG